MSDALEIREHSSPRLGGTSSIRIAAARSPRTRLDGAGLSAEDHWLELDRWGNGFLQRAGGGTVVLGPQIGSTPRSSPDLARTIGPRGARGLTMTRPISLGEVLAWKPLRKLGIAIPGAAGVTTPHPPGGSPAMVADDRTVLSAAEDERFTLVHGDNFGCVERRGADGAWRPVGTVADYMPAGADRRYLRRVGEAYGEFQRRRGVDWKNEDLAGARRQRLYLIDGRFEILTDAEYERLHGVAGGWMSI